MASLPNPGKCSCGSDFLLREHHPERWVCYNCKAVVISRDAKPITGICRECGAPKSDGIPFSKHSNICLACKSRYNKQYRIDNRDELLKQHRDSYQRDKYKRRTSVSDSVQKSPESFIKYLIRMLSRVRSNKFKRSQRSISVAKLAILRTVTITYEYMLDIYNQQDGMCALTGLKMSHRVGDMLCMSIDRKDSDVGYIPGNVQLVCQFANKAKGAHSNDTALAVFRAIRKLGVSNESDTNTPVC